MRQGYSKHSYSTEYRLLVTFYASSTRLPSTNQKNRDNAEKERREEGGGVIRAQCPSIQSFRTAPRFIWETFHTPKSCLWPKGFRWYYSPFLSFLFLHLGLFFSLGRPLFLLPFYTYSKAFSPPFPLFFLWIFSFLPELLPGPPTEYSWLFFSSDKNQPSPAKETRKKLDTF
ncbi:hypothetical protein V8C35DRAFT_288969 [Trichoderma chlorosporum]